MYKIIVTGATSMIGVATVEEAIKHKTQVYAIVRPNTSRLKRLPDSPYVHLIERELSDISEMEELPEADVFYHFAWIGTNKAERDNPEIQERNIKYSLNAVELACRCHCRRFIGAGSQAEYGIVTDTISENTATNPEISYGMAKLSACMLCKKCCEQAGIDFFWGRIFSVYGINDNAGTMIDYAIKQFISGNEALFSAATQMWNYLYEADAGRIFYLLGEVNCASGIYNIANRESYPLHKYIEILAEVSKVKFGFDIKYSFEKKSVGNVVTLLPDVGKLVNAIGELPMTRFEEGIEKMILSKYSDYLGGGVLHNPD